MNSCYAITFFMLIWVIFEVLKRANRSMLERFNMHDLYLITVNSNRFLGEHGLLVNSSKDAAKVTLKGHMYKMFIRINYLTGTKYLHQEGNILRWKSFDAKNKHLMTFQAIVYDAPVSRVHETNPTVTFYNLKVNKKWVGANDLRLSLTDKKHEAAKFYFIKTSLL